MTVALASPAAHRLEPVVFAHVRLPLMTVTADGVVLEVNAACAALLGRVRSEMVQEPLGRYVALRSAIPVEECLRVAARSDEAVSFGVCAVRCRNGTAAERELIVSSGCRATGRELLLIQLVPPVAPPAR